MESNPDPTFVKHGSLESPGIVGRLVRLTLGACCLFGIHNLIVGGDALLSDSIPDHLGWWFMVAMALWLTPIVRIAFRFARSWGNWRPRAVVAIVFAIITVGSMVLEHTPWTPATGLFLILWMGYVFGHLGICFVLSAIIGTPGCEMRSIPHLWTLITGQETKEHACPGFLDDVDRWERKTKRPRDS